MKGGFLRAAKSVNLVLMFVLELVVYVVAAFWGWTTPSSVLLKAFAAVGLVSALALTWARWGAPRAPYRLYGWHRALLEVPWFGSAYVLLALLGRLDWATGFAFWYGLNTTLRIAWRQNDEPPAEAPAR